MKYLPMFLSLYETSALLNLDYQLVVAVYQLMVLYSFRKILLILAFELAGCVSDDDCDQIFEYFWLDFDYSW